MRRALTLFPTVRVTDARAEMVERGLPRTLARVLDAHRKSPLVVGAIASAAGMMTSEESDAGSRRRF